MINKNLDIAVSHLTQVTLRENQFYTKDKRLTGMFLSINLMKRPWWFILSKAFDKSRAQMFNVVPNDT